MSNDAVVIDCCICGTPTESLWFSEGDVITCEECW